MTREQKIDIMAKALYLLAWGPSSHWPPHNIATHARFIEKAIAVDDALTAAGMVIVPREPTEAMLSAGEDCFVSMAIQGRSMRKAYRAMTEAYNG